MFITTANVTHTIPKPLLDRMEVIQIPGYVEEEKIHIARRHLWPRLLKEHGLAKLDISISDAALRRVIVEYTYEAAYATWSASSRKLPAASPVATSKTWKKPRAVSKHIKARE